MSIYLNMTYASYNAISFGSPLLRLLENLPADQHPADFVGPCPDLVELGVAQQPPGRELVDVAVATQALDRLECHPGRLLRGEQDGSRGVLPRGLATVARACDRVDVCLRGIHGHVHVSELGLHQREAADRGI